MGASTKSIRASRDADRPTLLMVGGGDPMDAALRVALDRHGLFVEAVGLDNLRRSVNLTAPDLILLLGDAAEEGGVAALGVLAADPSSAAVPVVLLAPDARLESRMHAFRHGAMAVVPRSASADAVARKIAGLTREMSEHFEEKTGEIGEATFDELVELVKKELRSGILSVHAPNHKGGPMRVVLGAGRPVAQAVQEFVARLKPHVAPASAMYYQFHTSAGGPVELLDMDGGAGDVEALSRLRVLLVDDDPARADTLAQELRARGSIVFVTDTAGRGLERAVGLDPQVAIIDAAGLEGPGFEVVRSIRKDLRLRWASILVAPWDEIWPHGAGMPDIEKLAARIEPLLVPERDLAERAAGPDAFDARLESTGPGRMLRILVSCTATFHVTVRNPKAIVELDLAEGLLVGATARTTAGQSAEGTAALAVLLALGSGRAHVEHRANPSVANVMTPVDEALSAASAERSIVPASHPPEPLASKPVGPAPAGPTSNADRWTSTASAEAFVAIEDDSGPQEETLIKDLASLAKLGEAVLVEEPAESPPAAPAPTSSDGGGPVAANERNRPARRHRSTLQMGAPAALRDVPPPKAPLLAGKAPANSAAETATVRPAAPYPAAPTDEPPLEAALPLSPPLPPPPALPSAMASPVGGLPPPPTEPEPPDVAVAAPRDDLAPAAMPPTATDRVAPSPAPVPRRRSPARALALTCVTLASIVLFAVLGLIGYRYSGMRQPELDRVLVMLGAPAPHANVPSDDANDDAVSDDAVSDDAVSDDAANDDAVSDDAANDDAVSDDAVSDDAVSDDAASDDAASDDAASDDAASDDAANDDAANDDASDDAEAPTDDETAADPSGSDDGEDARGTDVSDLLARAGRAGSSEMAERYYRRVLELEPREHHAMVGLGRLLLERGAHAEAAEQLRGAVARRPRRAAYRIWLGDALAGAGDGAGARREWEQALELEPDNRQAQQRLGQ